MKHHDGIVKMVNAEGLEPWPLRQIAQPEFTARDILKIEDKAAFEVAREFGFANLAMGILGGLSLAGLCFRRAGWKIYYALAGIGHIPHKEIQGRNCVRAGAHGLEGG